MILISIYLMTYISISLIFFFFFNDTATTEIYTLSLHDALPISRAPGLSARARHAARQAPRATLSIRSAVCRARARAPCTARGRPLARAHRHGHDRRSRAEGQP